jgi:hypothetical protein
MPFDSLATPPEFPPDLHDERRGRRVRDILAGWEPRATAVPRRWRPLAVLQAGFARLPLPDKRPRPC